MTCRAVIVGACALAVAVLLGSAVVRGAGAGTDPEAVLAPITSPVKDPAWIFDGTLRRTGVDRWRVSLNDAMIFESNPAVDHGSPTFRVGVLLREGDNVIAIESEKQVADRFVRLGRWTKHVQLEQAEPKQFVILVQGDQTDAAARRMAVFRSALATALPDLLVLPVSSWDMLQSTITMVGRRAGKSDQVLVYYSGNGRLSRTDAEPILQFGAAESAGDSIPVGNLIRRMATLPSASLLLDIAYVSPGATPSDPQSAAQLAPVGTSAAWLRDIQRTAAIEVAYTNPFSGSPSTGEGFTNDFIAELQQKRGADCDSFARVAQQVASDNAPRKASAWPLFYTKDASSFRFCPPKSNLKLTVGKPIDAAPPLHFGEVTFGGTTAVQSPIELTVDGVPVPTPRAEAITVPLGTGRHVIELTTIRDGKVFSLGRTVSRPLPADAVSSTWSEDITAKIEKVVPKITSNESVDVGFLAGDVESRPARYEIRNNGVVVAQAVVPSPAKVLRLQAVRRIPLIAGANNIVLEVQRGNQFNSDSILVTRRRAQPLRGVIIGANAVPGAPPLKGAEADAKTMQDLLLRYTDAVPAKLKMLTGAGATGAAIKTAVDALQDSSGIDSTFVFYFAGYGVTLIDPATKAEVRCLVTADYRNDARACLSTSQIEAWLKPVGKALVIVDASYDGSEGVNSRTHRTFLAADTAWRLRSGTDVPNRTFLVASSGNAEARETPQGGYFTLALANAVRTSLDRPDAAELPLEDAFRLASEDATRRSDGRQTAVMKGVLSMPFSFSARRIDDLKREAIGIERSARNDLVSMRAIDQTRVADGIDLADKVIALGPGDREIRQEYARLLMLNGRNSEARTFVDAATSRLTGPAEVDLEWWLTSAELYMREGRIGPAITDAKQAYDLLPTKPSTTASLGLLYAVNGNYEGSYELLRPLVDDLAMRDDSLTDAELGRVLLHAYLSLRRSRKSDLARQILERFSDIYKGKSEYVQSIYNNPVFRSLWTLQGPGAAQIGVQSPWAHIVAQYLRGRDGYEKLLRNFQKDAEPNDPRDSVAFQCQLHFYLGMARTLASDPKGAAAEFEIAVSTRKVELVEYWFAKHEKDALGDVTSK